ncbi:hypothetical protein PNK_p0138 (plasmid) [Candidatus Protochlamydia naegleriophila]|uniref:Uncharacterized protein n=1 Tax=Candidatus Protochlamydia naegleriophila TaxID=389348 RepID=A0A0U5JFA8_9BACT|nr:nucleic acid/nucleotide deaminase domain-containing protein [Candidatus Protochlamydia naegleriophila]CUI18190.1 hypothetical protein PNK_p0138 [Candidatus Protochlamydia naegleriophila]
MKDYRRSTNEREGIFTQQSIKNLCSGNINFVSNEEHLHAEIRLLRFLYKTYGYSKNNNPLTIDLGISKLCCKLCAAGISAIKDAHNHVNIKYRGCHGNFYYGWKPSITLFLSNTRFPYFVGQEAFKIYENNDRNFRKDKRNKDKECEENKVILDGLKDLRVYEGFLPDLSDSFIVRMWATAAHQSDSPVPVNTTESPQDDSLSDEEGLLSDKNSLSICSIDD